VARLDSVSRVDQPKGLRLASTNREAWLDIDEETLYEHQSNLEKRLAVTRQEATNLSGRLDNPNYIAKAPEQLVEETRRQLADKELLIKRLEHELEVLD
jgi:valyl-tRNA synthetase